MDEIIKAISGDGFVSISAITSRELTERARNIHNMSPVVTAALGRTLAATSIIGCDMKKAGASLTARINGGGAAGTIIAVSDSSGNVRGYVQNPAADIRNKPDGKLNVGGIVGKNGMLSVIRDLGEGEPFTGSVALVSGEIGEDFAAYFGTSEQIPTVCALGVLVDRDRSVLAAGGYIARLLPGAPETTIDALERNVAATGYVTGVLAKAGADELVQMVMSGFSPRILEKHRVEYKCYCSRDRVLAALSVLDREELQSMKSAGEPVEVTCRFCDAVYNFDPAEIAGEIGK